MSGEITKTFTSTGLSELGGTEGGKTITIEATDAFSLDVEIKRGDSNWIPVETFTESTVKNFEWCGGGAVVRLNCTSFTANDVIVEFA